MKHIVKIKMKKNQVFQTILITVISLRIYIENTMVVQKMFNNNTKEATHNEYFSSHLYMEPFQTS